MVAAVQKGEVAWKIAQFPQTHNAPNSPTLQPVLLQSIRKADRIFNLWDLTLLVHRNN